jgi:flagellar biosynthesis/type III secretory pathway protein FliH
VSVRILRAGEAKGERLLAPGPSVAQRRRIVREELEAKLAAEALLADARASAATILARAREEATREAEAALREARAEADARMAAQWLAIRREESKALERQTDQLVTLAVVLAERLVGAALRLEPALVADVARTVLAEAQGARRAIVRAHPLDSAALRGHLDAAGPGLTVEVQPDETLERGHLKLHTDVGIIDAQLAPRLARLADALRDALR